jgi:stress response protein SCP2
MATVLTQNDTLNLAHAAPDTERIVVGVGYIADKPDADKPKLELCAMFMDANDKPVKASDDTGPDDCLISSVTSNLELPGAEYLVELKGTTDDEQIVFDLNKIPAEVITIPLVLASNDDTILGDVRNIYVHIADSETNAELAQYDPADNLDELAGIELGAMIRNEDGKGWRFQATGLPCEGNNFTQVIKGYGVSL